MSCSWRRECAFTETTSTRRHHLSKPDSILLFDWTRRVILWAEDLFKFRRCRDLVGFGWASRSETRESLDRVKKSFWRIRASAKLRAGRFLRLSGLASVWGMSRQIFRKWEPFSRSRLEIAMFLRRLSSCRSIRDDQKIPLWSWDRRWG